MHQTVGNVLRTLLHGEPPQNITTAKEFADQALFIAMHAMRVGMHTTLGSSPGNLVFNRDMFLNIPLIANWHAIKLKREHLIRENLLTLSLDQLTNQVIVLMGAGELLLLIKHEYCEVAWRAGIGIH